MNERVTISALLKRARREQWVTQSELAKRSGLSQSLIADIEAGRPVSLKLAQRIADALGIAVPQPMVKATGSGRTFQISKDDLAMSAMMIENPEAFALMMLTVCRAKGIV